MSDPRIPLIQHAHAILRGYNILPDSKSAYEIWFRHFDSDFNYIVESVKEHGDILPWLCETAAVYAEPDTNYATPSGRKVANKLLAHFPN